jgi:uncharacterized repeat protein (TIGR01451 family)
VKTNQKIRMGRVARALLAATSALLLVVGLWLLFSHFQVLAQPGLEATQADLDVQKDASKHAALPGDVLAYTITIHNTGDAAATAWLTDVLHSDLAYVPGSLGQNHGAPVMTDGVLTWNETVWGGQTVRIWFSAQVSPDTTATQIVNTAQVTGTGELVTDSETTGILSGLPPTSQIHSPDNEAIITEKGTLPISGVAWDASIPRPFPGAPVLQPIDNFGGGGTYKVEWTEAISAENYLLQEARNPEFSSVTTFSTSAAEYFIPGRDVGTYYYRVQAYNADVRPSRWSNVESVVVETAQASSPAPGLDSLSASVVMPTQVTASGPVTVWVRIDDGGWEKATTTLNAGGWWDWTYDWPMPEEEDVQHTIQTQARDAAGTPSDIDTITVTLRNQIYTQIFPFTFRRWPPIPYAPTLNDIANTDQDGNYTLSWSYADSDPDVQDPTSYTLQEAKNARENFSDVYSGSSTSRTFTDKEDGTYYYRVRGHNAAGPGEWSAVKSTTVRSRTFRYDFSRSFAKPAWPIRRTSLHQGDVKGVTWTEEHDGTMYILMNDKFDFAIASPWEKAPDPPYVIKVKAKVHDPGNLISYGIIFGGNGGSPCPAYRETGCLTHYYRLEVIWYGALKAQLKRIDQHEPDKGHGQGKELIRYQDVASSSRGDDWHTWKFKVKPDGIDIYFDGELFGSTSDTKYINDPYFGVYVSANEYKPAIGRFDYYYVEPD